jgi:hypothetical protein
MIASVQCPICEAGVSTHYVDIEEIPYFRCESCRSIHISPALLADVDAGKSLVRDYGEQYWQMERMAARDRASGSSLCRAGEAILYCRRPVERFLDIGAGPGYLLERLLDLLDPEAGVFHGVEKFPPHDCFDHPNYHRGTIEDLSGHFDAGVCIEVIEHLTPAMLRGLARGLRRISQPGSYWLFNTGMDKYVEHDDPGYLDPLRRGHIVSWSLAGARAIFGEHGFQVHQLPGKVFAFAAEFEPPDAPDYSLRIYQPLPQNLDLLRRNPLLYSATFESARSYFYEEGYNERTTWALSLQAEIGRLHQLAPGSG